MGLALCAVALALPPTRCAQFLARDTNIALETLAQGVWIWKFATLLLALTIFAADVFQARGEEAMALLEAGRSGDDPPSSGWNALAIAICCIGFSLRCFNLNAVVILSGSVLACALKLPGATS